MAATKKALANKLAESMTAAELRELVAIQESGSAPAKTVKRPAKKAAAKVTRKPRPKGAAKVSSKVITKGTRSAFVKDNPQFAGLATHEIRDLVADGAEVKGGWHLPTGFVREQVRNSHNG